jgi:hypothetical protein
VVLCPERCHVLDVFSVQALDELIDLWRHHHEHSDGVVVDRGEGVRRSSRHHMQTAGLKSVSRLTVLHVKPSVEHVERFVPAMMDVKRRLIARVGSQGPLANHKVSHFRNIDARQQSSQY